MQPSMNNKRHKRSNQQSPPAKILDKLKRNNQQDKKQKNIENKSAYLYQIIVFVSSILIGFFGFSLFVNNDATRESTFLPFGSNRTFPIYDIFPRSYWSTLIPGHYFALKTAQPNSSSISLMWFRQKLSPNNGRLSIRHLCRQEDQLNTYYWSYNDLHNFGHQTLHDNNLKINTSFIRFVNDNKVVSKIQFNDARTSNDLNSIILYVTTENPADEILKLHQSNEDVWITMNSLTNREKNYRIKFQIKNGDKFFQSFLLANSTMDRLEYTIQSNLFYHKHHERTIFVISNSNDDDLKYPTNFIAYQIIFNQSIEIELSLYLNDDDVNSEDFDYDNEMNERQQEFEKKFSEKFSFDPNISIEKIRFARTILSNAMGSIGYYYGYSLVDSGYSSIVRPYGPIQLLAVSPSRSVFPRGFLWDEGFQQLLISRWDPELSMAIIKSWLSLMNADGWIPREVILGDEAKSRVPSEFIVQHSSNANPPSLLLAIESLIDRGQYDHAWLEEIYPRLYKWYQWFNKTQTGKYPYTFRWRGRNSTTKFELNPKTLTSGLDDYPRATHPTEHEIHIDLRCWMTLATRLMSKISNALKIEDEFHEYHEILSDNHLLEQLHWSDKYEMFCDKGLHSVNVSLKKIHNNDPKNPQTWFERVVNSEPHYDCVNEFGYISLFPFMMTILKPNNDKLGKILNNIENPDILWSPFGLRSLSKKSSYYKKYNTEHDPPYWRGSIWINMNYLILNALNHYSKEPGPYQMKSKEIYSRLKMNLIESMYKEFKRTGYVWEQYQDDNGNGRGAHPFTGWTSLIVLIMANE